MTEWMRVGLIQRLIMAIGNTGTESEFDRTCYFLLVFVFTYFHELEGTHRVQTIELMVRTHAVALTQTLTFDLEIPKLCHF